MIWLSVFISLYRSWEIPFRRRRSSNTPEILFLNADFPVSVNSSNNNCKFLTKSFIFLRKNFIPWPILVSFIINATAGKSKLSSSLPIFWNYSSDSSSSCASLSKAFLYLVCLPEHYLGLSKLILHDTDFN